MTLKWQCCRVFGPVVTQLNVQCSIREISTGVITDPYVRISWTRNCWFVGCLLLLIYFITFCLPSVVYFSEFVVWIFNIGVYLFICLFLFCLFLFICLLIYFLQVAGWRTGTTNSSDEWVCALKMWQAWLWILPRNYRYVLSREGLGKIFTPAEKKAIDLIADWFLSDRYNTAIGNF